jgi:hypothetical protein
MYVFVLPCSAEPGGSLALAAVPRMVSTVVASLVISAFDQKNVSK